ncbi:MAG: galactokinase [Clostridiales bacterium]|nr:galactokinase [Clostridiales bacterium]
MTTIKAIRAALLTEDCRRELARVYCREENTVGPVCCRLEELMDSFQKAFQRDEDTEVALCTAAGRTEVGGNHTDHQRGKVLAASVDLDAVACVAPNGTGEVCLCSEGYGTVRVRVDELDRVSAEENTTPSLVRGILARTAQLGYRPVGFDAYIRSDVPGGSGLSSSACYEVLVGVIVNHLYCHDELSLAQIAMMGQYAENVYFGKPSGLMDQMACALGGIVAIDFRDENDPVYHQVTFDFMAAGHVLCIIDTGADHADLTADYGAIPREMRAVAAQMGKEVLSETDPTVFYAQLPRLRERLGDRAVLRAIHYYDDVSRVEQQVQALERGDFDTFLRLVNQSGQSSFMYLQNVSTFRDPADQPVAVALAAAQHLLAGQGAVRVHGGGFAGTIQAFVPLDRLEVFRTGMDALLGQGSCHILAIRPVGGAVLFG